MKHKILLTLSVLSLLTSCSPTYSLSELTHAKVNKYLNNKETMVSEITYNSYSSFAKKFTKLVYSTLDEEESIGISIPDAYLTFSMLAYISTDEARNDVLRYLELDNIDELKLATKEIIKTTASLHKNYDGEYVGGYSLNSLWFNLNKVTLLEKDEALYKDLEEIFDVTSYNEPLTSDKANEYLKEYGLKNKPTPKIELDDDNPSAVSTMSVYYLLDYYEEGERDYYHSQYLSGNHKLDYHLKDETLKVDYISTVENTDLYVGNNFKGASSSINNLSMTYFLPNEVDIMPSIIIDDVLDQNYEKEVYMLEDEIGESFETSIHEVSIDAPYFSLDNKINISRASLMEVLPIITKGGAARRMVDPKPEYAIDLFLNYIKQFSVMKYNYDGFYSCSVTIAGIEGYSAFPLDYRKYNLKLDHPYVFEVNKSLSVNNSMKSVPLIIGEIVNPNYKD